MAGCNIQMADFHARYEKTASYKLAQTGMSTVWLMRDKIYGRKVVVKFLNPKTEDLPALEKDNLMREFRERFEQEAQIAAQLIHPNIVTVYDFGTIDNKLHYIVSEYVDGRNFEDALNDVRKKGIFSVDEALLMFYQICEPIAFAHNKGNIIHRDLKPNNVLLGMNGKLAVCDWGISKILQRDAGDDGSGSKLNLQQQFVTAPDVIIGTPSYLSPEQVRGQPVDKRTDVYQLGAVLYYILTGKFPFSSKQEAIRRRQELDDHSYEKIQGLDSALIRIQEKSMQTEKEDRYQSVEEFQAKIKSYMDTRLNTEEILPEASGTTLTRLFRRGTQKKKPKQVLILSDIVKKWVKR
ncbi:MAG: serine/threonine-protein kinase [Candidatus Woesearchaeota archaeon]